MYKQQTIWDICSDIDGRSLPVWLRHLPPIYVQKLNCLKTQIFDIGVLVNNGTTQFEFVIQLSGDTAYGVALDIL